MNVVRDSRAFAKALIDDPGQRTRVSALLDTLRTEGTPWDHVPSPLGPEIDRFEHQHIAAAYARILGGESMAIERRQDFLVRTAVTSILFPLEAFEDRLLHLIERRGLPSLFQHVVREFADAGAEIQTLFEASGVCRVAAFEIEDLLRAAAEDNLSAATIVKRRNTIVERTWERVEVDKVPYGWQGVALLWVAALVDLGGMSDTNTTEHYNDA